jgi:hypothetical protein
MTASEAPSDWTEANQRYLTAAVDVVRALLAAHIARATGEVVAAEAMPTARARLLEAKEALPGPSALETLSAAFGLSPFERDILVLCAGIELRGDFGRDVAVAQGDPRSIHPTFGLAMAALPDAHWSAITPSAPLRRWRLVELLQGVTLTSSPLRIDERILHYLAGVPQLDVRLQGMSRPASIWEHLPASLQSAADRLKDSLSLPVGSSGRSAIQLFGSDRSGITAVAAQAWSELGRTLLILHAADLPSAAIEREALARLLEREAVLSRAAFLVDLDEADTPEVVRSALALAEVTAVQIMIAAREPVRARTGSSIGLRVERPGVDEQRELWHNTLGSAGAALNGSMEPIVAQFSLGLPAIQAASVPVLARWRAVADGILPPVDAEELGQILWEACREQARPRLEDLTQRIDPIASWDDIVLPEPHLQTLREVATQVHQRARVYEAWGFGAKSTRGLGISALFAGASGTGKTMAAEVLARDLRLDLYRIDLSQVVSKYIGETEKNLRRVFDAAEEGGAVLLFDEADALFGKRSEVKDSHDRYANIEVSYLLQRMESYRGLAILTTNMKSALDPAFLRRIRFVVQFPFPEALQRAEIWRRVFPAQTPTQGLEPGALARLVVAGGSIRNIALNAAFLAADAGEPIQMTHLLRAARGECTKLEKPLTDAEVGAWA